MNDGYLEVGDIEIANNDRTKMYATMSGLTVPDLAGGPKNINLWPDFAQPGPYVDPTTDGAPWVDPARPASQLFTGFFIERITGFDSTMRDRQVYNSINGGGSVGPLRMGPRRIDVRLVGTGTGEEALNDGLEWLTHTLINRCPPDACQDGTAKFYISNGAEIPACAIPGVDTVQFTPEQLRREALGVSLLNPPRVVGRWASRGCYRMYSVTFSLLSNSPYLYGPMTAVPGDNGIQDHGPFDVELPCCDNDAARLFTPRCFATPINQPQSTTANCWCQPGAVFRSILEVPGSTAHDLATQIRFVIAGESQNLRLAIYNRYPGDPAVPAPGDNFDFWECNRKAAVLEIPELPDQSLFVADSRTGGITLETLADNRVYTSQIVQGEAGTPFALPSIKRGCGDLIYVLETDCDAAGTGAWQVLTAPQYMTAGE